MINRSGIYFLLVAFVLFCCSEDKGQPEKGIIQLQSVTIGLFNLKLTTPTENTDVPFDKPLVVTFSAPVDTKTIAQSVHLKVKNGDEVSLDISFQDGNKTIIALPKSELISNQPYEFTISDQLLGANGEAFQGFNTEFITIPKNLLLTSVVIDGQSATTTNLITEVNRNPLIEITFSASVNSATITNTTVRLLGGTINPTLSFTFSDANRKLIIAANLPLEHLRRHVLSLSADLIGTQGEVFNSYSKIFYTEIDPTPKLPILPNDEDSDNDNTNDLLSVVQSQTFKYFYDFAHPASGMARERNTSGDLVTSGGSGFGVMALIVGMKRNFITREQGLDRMDRILDFLESADRFHGAWSHWINGNTGKVIPFSANDNGGDLVETAFLVEGLITFRQYLNQAVPAEQTLFNRINVLWKGVEWDWYQQNNQNVLYWHWSPDKNWIMNHQIKGWNEALIIYTLAAAADSDNTIPKSAYDVGWASNGGMINGKMYEGVTLPLGFDYGGPLFFTHYSFLGLDPRNLNDQYANYWTQNVSHSQINYKYSVRNPKKFVGYGEDCWGLTASDNQSGYSAHSPTNDLGVITPTAALSSFPYTPVESMRALKFFYYGIGDKLWGQYGFYDAFNTTAGWTANSYLAIDQGPIVVMIENYRTSLLWDLFMSAPEVQAGLTKLNFTY